MSANDFCLKSSSDVDLINTNCSILLNTGYNFYSIHYLWCFDTNSDTELISVFIILHKDEIAYIFASKISTTFLLKFLTSVFAFARIVLMRNVKAIYFLVYLYFFFLKMTL